jgi:hypothetical protein
MMRLAMVLFLFVIFPCNVFAATVTFDWVAPTLNCDGSDLNDLSGYAIMWGAASGGPYLNQHNVDDSHATSVTVNVGTVENTTLYFVAISVDSAGNRSDDLGACGASNEVSISFGPVAPAPPMSLTASQP